MPPLLTAKTCWRAGWVVIGLGIALIVASNAAANAVFSGQGPEALAQALYTVLSVVAYMTPTAGMVLLVGSLVLRHVERLTGALVASGTISALPVPSRAPQRRVDGAVDLDDLDADDVVGHEPGVR